MFKYLKKISKLLFATTSERYNFLYVKIYDYFYTVYSLKYLPLVDTVDIPEFITIIRITNLASKRTKIELDKIMREGRLNKCYQKAIME